MTSTSPAQVFAVITAAGSGTRLGSDRPKALVDLDGMSLVERALRNLHSGGVDCAVVTAPPDRFEEFRALLDTAEFRDVVRVVRVPPCPGRLPSRLDSRHLPKQRPI